MCTQTIIDVYQLFSALYEKRHKIVCAHNKNIVTLHCQKETTSLRRAFNRATKVESCEKDCLG